MRKAIAAAALVCAVILIPNTQGQGQTTADDVKWINQCVADNKDEGQTQQVVLTYCTCMVNKMSNNETRSVSQWEKANPRTAEACSREAGWKGR